MKKQSVYLYGLLTLFAGLVLTSCDKASDPNNEVEYLPFQESKDGKWGLISNEGKVLFTEEFQNEPTLCVNGRFMVKNADGLWEIYTDEKKPEKVGGEYLQASMFYDDLAVVVEKGKPIQFIDRDGKVKVTLDKVNGKPVANCSYLFNGLAMVKVEGFWGVVNKKGDIVVEPEYAWINMCPDGRMIGLHKRYQEAEHDKHIYTILNRKGKEIGSLKASKINSLRVVNTSYRTFDNFVEDGVVVAATKNDRELEGIMGIDGEWMLKPNDKIAQFKERRGDMMTFVGSDGYGLVDLKGETHIRPKFYELHFVDSKLLAGKKERRDGFILYDLEGEKVCQDEYELIFNFHQGEDYTLAKIGTGDYTLLNREGKEKKLEADVYQVGEGATPDFLFEGDYVDIGEIVNALKIQKDGFINLLLGMKAPQAIETIAKLPNIRNFINGAAKYNTYGDYLTADMMIGKAMVDIEIAKAGLIKTSHRRSGWFTYTDYTWSDKPISNYQVFVSSDRTEQLKGQMKTLFTAIANEVKKQGSVVKEGKNAVVVNTKGKQYYYAYYTGERVYLCYGNYDPDALMVSEFDNVTEEDPVVPAKMLKVQEVDTDTVALDSIEV